MSSANEPERPPVTDARLIRILLVDDDPGDVRLAKLALADPPPSLEFVIETAPTLTQALALLKERDFDLVLLDLGLPDSRGFSTLKQVHAACPHVSIVVLTGLADEDAGVMAIKEGADDYLVKGSDLSRGTFLRALRYSLERKAMTRRLTQAERLQSVGRLAAGIAHEINTPAQFIGDNTRFLQESFSGLILLIKQHRRLLDAARAGPVPPELLAAAEATCRKADTEYLVEEIPRAIEQTLEGVERVAGIIGAMKAFAHPGPAECAPTDVNKALETTVTVARSEWKYVAETTMDLDPELPLVPCRAGDFNQAVLNIIVNAAHAIADVVGDGANGKGTIAVSTRRQDDWAEIRIRDTGCGIPAAIRSRVFEPFFTTKKVGKGSGQGLAIAHAIIHDKHRGELTFETTEGHGTTFIVRLPLGSKATQPPRA